MKIKEGTYSTYNLPFKKNFITAKSSYKFRSGFILKIVDELGNTAFGEAAPLEGFGTDSFDEAEKNLQRITDTFNQVSLPDKFSAISDFSLQQQLSPTVHFALDQCLLSLYLMRNSNALSTGFPNRKLLISINYVIGFHSPIEVISQIKESIAEGFSTFKIKVGRENIEDDIEIISAIRNAFGSSINLRLDANAKWEPKEAVKNIQQLEQFKIQYIEQPVSGIAALLQLSENVSVPITPDECIKIFDDTSLFLKKNNIKFIVLKPSLLGSIFNTLRLIEKANESNKIIIVSSAFESAFGRSAVNFIASLLNHQYPHGLATSKFFKSDIAKDFYKIKNGKIDITEYPPEFD